MRVELVFIAGSSLLRLRLAAESSAMPHVVFQLVGGPWDGQMLSTASDDEANACFAQALLAISGGRQGTRIPLMPPGAKRKKTQGNTRSALVSPLAHDYEIASRDEQAGKLVIVARHIGGMS